MTEGRIIRADKGDPFKASGHENGGRLDMFVLDVAYRFGPPLHTHVAQEDSFFVLDGILTVQLGDDLIELSPGDFASAPPGVVHSFTNARVEGSVRLVNIMTPGIGFDGYIKQVTDPDGIDPAGIDELNQHYGVEVVGPSLAETLGLS